MYISVTNQQLKQSLMLQLSCIELSKNVHRFLHIYHHIIVGVHQGLTLLPYFIIIIQCSPLDLSELLTSGVCARFVAQLCYTHVVGII